MIPWWVISGFLVGGALIFVGSLLGYRQRVAWYKEYDRKHPGVAEKLGVRPRA